MTPPPLAGLGLFWTWDFIEMGYPHPPKINLGLFWTWDFFEAEWPAKNSSKQDEYEKYWYIIYQYEWFNGIFGPV